jgi:hypothetical protein
MSSDFEALLATKNSRLAQLFRLYLVGLRATLDQSYREDPSDPGWEQARLIVCELDRLVNSQQERELDISRVAFSHAMLEDQESSSASVQEYENARSTMSDQPRVQTFADALPLRKLREMVFSDLALSPYLGDIPFQSADSAVLWHEIQSLFLRIPISLATPWRKRALKIAEEIGAIADNKNVVTISFRDQTRDDPDVIFSGLSGTVEARGLCLSQSIPFDLGVPYEVQGNELDFLASVVSICLKFIELEPSKLHHALESLDYFRISSLENWEQRDKYSRELLTRFRQVQATQGDAEAALKARIRLDEAIQALIYQPLVTPDSWWGGLQQAARRTLNQAIANARQAGCEAQIRPLSGRYSDVLEFSSKHDLELDSSGIPGEVAVCLRVFARIQDKKYPGRVIFRSLQS